MKTACLLFLILLAASFAEAAENRWANTRGGGKWENGANWSLDIPPNINHDVVIAASLSETVTIDATTAALPNNMVISSLRVGRTGNFLTGTDTLNLLNAGLTPLIILGSDVASVISNRGIVTITGSILDVGRDLTVNGSVRLNSGSTLNAKDGLVMNGGSVMLNANSVLNVKGNNFPAYDLSVDGSVTLNGGLLTFSNSFASGMAVGNLGQGSVNLLGGELRVAGSAYLDVGVRTGSVGSVTIAGGTARLEGQSFAVGSDAGATGSVLVASGELITADTFVGGAGVGRLTVSNGIWRANPENSVNIGALGAVTLAGGTSVVSRSLFVGRGTNVGGSLVMTGGTLLTTNTRVTIQGVADISNGLWRAEQITVGDGLQANFGTSRMVIVGGMTTILSNLVIGRCDFFAATGRVTVVGGQLIVTNAATNATLRVENGVLRIEGGTLIADTIDLTRPCARLERAGGTLIYRTALLDPSRDDDGDGAPNGLEQSKGTDPLDPVDKQRDSDGDGASDVHEMLAGTDRFNSNSVFKIISILPQGADLRLRWKTVAGKTNIIQAVERLGVSNIFEDLATLVLPGTGDRTNTFIEAEGASKGPSRLYRVKVIP